MPRCICRPPPPPHTHNGALRKTFFSESHEISLLHCICKNCFIVKAKCLRFYVVLNKRYETLTNFSKVHASGAQSFCKEGHIYLSFFTMYFHLKQLKICVLSFYMSIMKALNMIYQEIQHHQF